MGGDDNMNTDVGSGNLGSHERSSRIKKKLGGGITQ